MENGFRPCRSYPATTQSVKFLADKAVLRVPAVVGRGFIEWIGTRLGAGKARYGDQELVRKVGNDGRENRGVLLESAVPTLKVPDRYEGLLIGTPWRKIVAVAERCDLFPFPKRNLE